VGVKRRFFDTFEEDEGVRKKAMNLTELTGDAEKTPRNVIEKN